ncbi:AGAP011649-PA-like protein [Anopheles sinensis]|uniref:AGAP011649-PA-like protein n=1 Tax=Anopheles sinensis TaxID=74873 RepID=A0A084VBC4_ANOSI|nr:AGAP011649-PA-like protein [Anopheles sinensis]
MKASALHLPSWIILVLSTGNAQAFNMACSAICIIDNLNPAKDGMFMLQYVPRSHRSILFGNLSVAEVDAKFMDAIADRLSELHIADSPMVQKLTVSKRCNLSHLIVTKSRLSSIVIEENESLNLLRISSSLLNQIPPGLRHLKALSYLGIFSCPIVTLDLAPFCTTRSLKSLRLRKNKIRYILNSSPTPCSPVMEDIDLSDNQWLQVTSYICMVVAFRMKCKNMCVIENLRPQKDGSLMFRYLSTSESYGVKFLNLRSTVVTEVFLDEIGQYVDDVEIEKSPVVQQLIISTQCNLLHLHISDSRLRFIQIEGNVRLTSLKISSTLLEEVPATLRYLHAATVIDISECPIVTLDLAPFCSTLSLHWLKLTKNKIRYIVNSSTVPCSPLMKQIELDENHIQVLNLELFSTSSRLLRAGFKKNAIKLVMYHGV